MLRCAYFNEELEQWMTDGVTTETGEDGRSVVCWATHLMAFSAIAYDGQSVASHSHTLHIMVCCVSLCAPTGACSAATFEDCNDCWMQCGRLASVDGPFLQFLSVVSVLQYTFTEYLAMYCGSNPQYCRVCGAVAVHMCVNI